MKIDIAVVNLFVLIDCTMSQRKRAQWCV